MTRYADPQRCPDCLQAIEHGITVCPSCTLPLSGPVAGRLFQTLAHADELLTALRTLEPGVVRRAEPPLVPAGLPPSDLPPAPRGLSAASVPKILLGLGAICLLVAALVFLAVTWSALGVAGRTATLVGFTVVAGGLAAWVASRNLRSAAEALSVVALGLVSFDVLGARDSGWFGDIDEAAFLVLLGAVVAVAAGAAALVVRRSPVSRLVGAEIVSTLGMTAMTGGFVIGSWFSLSAALSFAVVVAAAAAFAAHRLRLGVLAVGVAVLAALTWLVLVSTAVDRAMSNPTAPELWLDLEAWPLVVAALLVGALAAVRLLPLPVRVAGPAAAQLLLAGVALIPFLRGSTTELTLAVLAVLVVACALTWFVPKPWAFACAVTATMSTGWIVLIGGMLSVLAVARLARAGGNLWQGAVDGRLPALVFDGPDPWLLPVVTVAVVVSCVVLAESVSLVDRLLAPLADLALGLSVAAASVVATVALYPTPVWVVLGLMLTVGIAFTGWSLRGTGGTTLVVGSSFTVLAVATSLYDERLSAVALLVAVALAGGVHLRWARMPVSVAAGGVLAASLAGSVWTWGALADAHATWTALSALVVLGGLVLAVPAAGERAWRFCRDDSAIGSTRDRSAQRRFTGVEVGSLVSGVVVAVAGVAASSSSLQPTWTAAYLTTAGVVASLTALLRPDHRRVGWLGGALLATASWVRLWDIGVQAPEAYTLPSAAALAIAGLMQLRHRPGSSTMAALAPSLSLGLVPSLLWVLWEPVGLRSVLLGLACLALLVLGVRLRWAAPVGFAAAVGTLVVLRQVTPITDAVPQWVLIGSAGTLLVGMGITWERRINEARAVLGYVRALR